MDELEDRLRGITLAEPPLGFDPDEVAGKAAKKARNRRGVVATGIATLAVIAAAVVFVAPGNGPAPAVPPIPVAPSPSGAPSPSPSPAPANGDLAARKARISGHLATALPGVLTGAKDVRIRSVHQLGTWDALVFMIGYRDASGADRPLLLTVLGVEAAKRGFSLEDSCKPGRRPRGGFDADLGGVTSGEPVDCVKLLQPDRSTVVVTGTVPSLPPGDVEPGRDAIAYRADGTVVAVSTGAGDGGSRPPDDQLIKLVSDPELDLR